MLPCGDSEPACSHRQAEREQRITEEQAEMGDSDRQLEEAELARLLQPLGLVLHDIPVHH